MNKSNNTNNTNNISISNNSMHIENKIGSSNSRINEINIRNINQEKNDDIKINNSQIIKNINSNNLENDNINSNDKFLLNFSDELNIYYQNVILSKEEIDKRYKIVQELKEIISQYNKEWRLELVGSLAQNLSVKNSDLDFTIFIENSNSGSGETKKKLYELNKLFNKKKDFCKSTKIIFANVPIIKVFINKNGFKIYADISINSNSGINGTKIIKNIVEKNNLIKVATIILKSFLKHLGFNDASIGGMSSFVLFHTVYHLFLKEFQNENLNNKIILGKFIEYYFKYYGIILDFKKYGITVYDNQNDYIYPRDYEIIKNVNCIECKSIEDKNKPIGNSCTKYKEINEKFKQIHDKIATLMNSNEDNILKKLNLI